MEGLTAVQGRIAEIQNRILMLSSNGVSPTSAAWSSAAAAAGLSGTSATAAATSLGTGDGSAGSAVVSEASKYLGVPYAWGGTDPSSGLDCSGLVQLVYGNLGMDLPRTAAQQATAGTPVASLDEARPGDLVFFDNSSARSGIDHVGIYIGNGKMIAAPQEGDVVKVQSVGNPTLIRRVLPDTAAASAVGSSATSAGGLAGVPYSDLFASAGARYGIDPSLLAAVAKTESNFDSSAVSSTGATGLMQFMPATASSLGIDASNPSSAIDGAARYLRQLTDQFGSTSLALAAYNAGPGAVSRSGGVPPYGETQSYVSTVLSAAEAYS